MRDITKQPTMNIGTIGHVAHGKSTLVKQISKINPIKYKSELERNITIKLGYANAKIYKCFNCKRPNCYQITESCPIHLTKSLLVKHVSFIDCPGHDILMATMLSGTSIMDNSILLIAANEPVPRPQTIEHLFALELIKQNLSGKMLIIQNKIDLINKSEALKNYTEIKSFIKNSIAEEAPIIPTAIQRGINLSAILDFIVQFPEPEITIGSHMVIIRSFDINKPKKISSPPKIFGGVIGGSITKGSLSINQLIEIRPGIIKNIGKKDNCNICLNNIKFKYQPFISKIISLKSDEIELQTAMSGGLIAIQTNLDPFFCKSDKLVGQIITAVNCLDSPPIVCDKISIKYRLLEKVVNNFIIESIKYNESLLINIGSQSVGAVVSKWCNCVGNHIDGSLYLNLVKPICCVKNDKIAISRKIKNHWRLIGFGEVISSNEIDS